MKQLDKLSVMEFRPFFVSSNVFNLSLQYVTLSADAVPIAGGYVYQI